MLTIDPQALDKAIYERRWSVSGTARVLGITRQQLHNLLNGTPPGRKSAEAIARTFPGKGIVRLEMVGDETDGAIAR